MDMFWSEMRYLTNSVHKWLARNGKPSLFHRILCSIHQWCPVSLFLRFQTVHNLDGCKGLVIELLDTCWSTNKRPSLTKVKCRIPQKQISLSNRHRGCKLDFLFIDRREHMTLLHATIDYGQRIVFIQVWTPRMVTNWLFIKYPWVLQRILHMPMNNLHAQNINFFLQLLLL
jgi:hypothetical protein